MSTTNQLNRRQLLTTTMAGVSGAIAASVLQRTAYAGEPARAASPVAPKIRGPFLILSTPYTDSGAVDFDTLANEAKFVDWCGCPGMIWPQSGESIDLLTTEEKLQGMEVLSNASKSFQSVLCLGVQGKDTDEMLMFAKHVEKLAPPAIISRPPDSGKTEDDLRQYWRALATVANRPVFFQTTGGIAYKGPIPSVPMMIELAKEFSQFGYIKEEAGNVLSRIQALHAAQPPIRRIFSARGGTTWPLELRLGSEGLITERAVYADVLTRVWELHLSGKDPTALYDTYSKFLMMANLTETIPNIPGNAHRGAQLYVWKKRGVFKALVSRQYGPNNTIPTKPIISELKLSSEDIAEIDARFEALKPYMKPDSPSFA
jgi:1-pyrroline-4-hydroxy-2-carboxylate deaminase